MNEKGEIKYNNFKNKKVIKIRVIGNSNKGKAFLLEKCNNLNRINYLK